MIIYFQSVSNTNNPILSWKSKRLFDESIKRHSKFDKMLNHSVSYVGNKAKAECNGDCLKQEKISFDYGKMINIYIVYEINKTFNSSSYPTLESCVFAAV